MACRAQQYKRRCSYVHCHVYVYVTTSIGIVWREHLFLMKPILRTYGAAVVKPLVIILKTATATVRLASAQSLSRSLLWLRRFWSPLLSEYEGHSCSVQL